MTLAGAGSRERGSGCARAAKTSFVCRSWIHFLWLNGTWLWQLLNPYKQFTCGCCWISAPGAAGCSPVLSLVCHPGACKSTAQPRVLLPPPSSASPPGHCSPAVSYCRGTITACSKLNNHCLLQIGHNKWAPSSLGEVNSGQRWERGSAAVEGKNCSKALPRSLQQGKGDGERFLGESAVPPMPAAVFCSLQVSHWNHLYVFNLFKPKNIKFCFTMHFLLL